MKKFMMTITKDMYLVLEKQAEKRDVSVQELIRAVVLADWVRKQKGSIPPVPIPIDSVEQVRVRPQQQQRD